MQPLHWPDLTLPPINLWSLPMPDYEKNKTLKTIGDRLDDLSSRMAEIGADIELKTHDAALICYGRTLQRQAKLAKIYSDDLHEKSLNDD